MHDEFLYRALFEQTNDAVFILNLDGRHTAVNSRATELLGYSSDTLLGMLHRDLVVETDADKVDQVLQALLNGEVIDPFERTYQRKDSTTFPAEVNVQLVYDDNRNPIHIQSVVRDITERKGIEEQLNYRALILQNVSDVVIATDTHSVIRSWNDAARKVYGWTAEEVIGRSLSDVIPTVTGDSEGHDGGHLIKEQYLHRGYWRSEVVQRRKDGRLLYVLSSVSVLRNSAGEPMGIVTVNHDITKRKQAELSAQRQTENLAALRQVDAEIGSTLDLDQTLLFALNAAVSLSGADAGFVALLDPDSGEGRVSMIHTYGPYQYLAESRKVLHIYGIAGRVLRQRKAEMIADVSTDPDYQGDLKETRALMAFPLMSRDRMIGIINIESFKDEHFTPDVFDFVGLLISRLAAAIDNARLYQLSQGQLGELQQVYEKVSNLEQLKTDMIRIASHDLRNPVGLLNGYLELLRGDADDRLTDQEKEFIEAMARALRRMQIIIDDILSLERIQQMAENQINEPVDMFMLVDRAAANHMAEAERKSLVVQTVIEPPDAPYVVLGDPTQLYEAVSNLISNAIKYTPDSGRIDIALSALPETIRLEVHDNGYGIPVNMQAKLFTPFFRAKTEETEEIEGVGLGLHLVSNIVRRHDGEMIFTSTYGEGSTFGFELPPAPLN
jgi:PAS domain S-box-containing protein